MEVPMTPYETALRLMSKTGTRVGDPEFIVAYLQAEIARTRDGDPLRLSPDLSDRIRLVWRSLRESLKPLADALNTSGSMLNAAFEQHKREHPDDYTTAL